MLKKIIIAMTLTAVAMAMNTLSMTLLIIGE